MGYVGAMRTGKRHIESFLKLNVSFFLSLSLFSQACTPILQPNISFTCEQVYHGETISELSHYHGGTISKLSQQRT